MAFIKPEINVIKPDISNLTVYIRSVKKWGKSTLFRSLILAKYGDPSYGLLVGCGKEKGYKLLDNLNKAHVDTYKDFIEFQKYIIENPGNVKIICFDTADEMCPAFEKEAIRLSNIENPTKQCRSIKSAFGGYMAGPEYVGEMIKAYIDKFIQAGFGVWVIAHSKFKTIKEKGGLDEDGYMQLTSNLQSNYEAAFGDIFDMTLTGVIDREYDIKGEGDKAKKYATDEVRKLYFRGTSLIDAGSRFADGAVPEYLTYNIPDMEFAQLFLNTCEEGMAKSKIDFTQHKPVSDPKVPTTKPKATPKKVIENSTPEVEDDDFGIDDDSILDDEPTPTVDINALCNDIRDGFRTTDKETKVVIKQILTKHGDGKLSPDLGIDVLQDIKTILDNSN